MEIAALKYRNDDTPPSLVEKLNPSASGDKQGLSEARIDVIIPIATKYVSFYREYPDIYLDSIVDPDTKFAFYFYQRVFLREVLRYKYMYATFPRAYSKSFLADLGQYVKCIFYPNTKSFIVASGKEQAAKIATEKLEEIWSFFPSLKDELRWGTGSLTTKMQKDYIRLMFKNGSILDVVAAIESTRGGRRTNGLIEECVTVNGEKLNQIIIPLMNVSRRAACGAIDPNDVTNKSQVYITTAGEKNTFA